MSELLIAVSYLVLNAALYLAWPSRWNIPAHLALATSIYSHILPIFVGGILGDFPEVITTQFALIMVLGASGFVAGILIVAITPSHTAAFLRAGHPRPGAFFERSLLVLSEARSRDIMVVSIVGLMGVVLSFAIMGFVPALAADPFEAKFFQGPYRDSYNRVSILFKISTLVVVLVIPICLAVWAQRRGQRRLHWLVIAGTGVFLMALTLQREPAVAGLLSCVVVFLVYKRHARIAILVVIGSYVAGGLFYEALSVLGVLPKSVIQDGGSGLSAVFNAVPDVADSARFLASWDAAGNPLSHGLTMLGGLVPGHFKWNPAVWVFAFGNSDLDAVSGGYRLPIAIWGAVSFGYIGAFLVPFISGLLSALLIRRLSVSRLEDGPAAGIIILVAWQTVAEFTDLQIDYTTVLRLVIFCWLIRKVRTRNGGQLNIKRTFVQVRRTL